jgi:3D (Asp-Asp-Asp) domain-containing protein
VSPIWEKKLLNSRKVITGIALVAAFCGYLLLATSEPVNSEKASILLSGSTVKAPPVLSDEEILSRIAPPAYTLGTESEPPLPATMPPETAEPEAPEAPTATAENRNYREVWAVVTAYCPCSRCCGRHANGRTATGKSAWTRGFAAAPDAVPYGTKVYVEGYGQATVDDTGGAMRTTYRRSGVVHLDVRMTYHWQARQWGRKFMRVRIYE